MDESAHSPEPAPGRSPRTEPATGTASTQGRDRGPLRDEPLETRGGHAGLVDPELVDPELVDPELVDHVRALLASVPAPGPMPTAVSDRIEAALLEEARLRVEPGPLGRRQMPPAEPGDGQPDRPGDGAVFTLPARAGRSNRTRPAYLVAAVAAAAVVVAAGASALHVTKRPNGAAALGGSYQSSAPTPPTAAGTEGGLHVQLSKTAYTAGTLAAGARTLLDHPGPAVRDLAAESPAIGPIATPIGLESCLEAIGAVDAAHPDADAVSVDLASFEGRPAAILVVTRAGASTAWAVERSCTTGTPGVLAGATPVP
ncbi:hypothetical protein [Terrabacter sp. NPDC080008]|uniref:hypothetical protein n=1 Tax=Terrabacter sp. NPDC080008 TaxID=3155176 RepID=UPI00344F3FCE